MKEFEKMSNAEIYDALAYAKELLRYLSSDEDIAYVDYFNGSEALKNVMAAIDRRML